MRRSGRTIFLSAVAGVAACVVLFAEPASAQNLFDSIFGGLSRALAPPSAAPTAPTVLPAYAEPAPARSPAPNRSPQPTVAGGGVTRIYCVRSCDGFAFPVHPQPGMSIAQACHAFCPASETRVYRGETIDGAVGSDGRRYADLPNALVYRKHLVAGCTCNGRDVFGLAPIDPRRDPTLKPGDVIVTGNGLFAFTGGTGANTDFTPVRDYSRFSRSYRAELSAIHVAPPAPGAPGEFTSAIPTTDNRTAQLAR
jgi:Protein of unknown function (DUF2865)